MQDLVVMFEEITGGGKSILMNGAPVV